MLAIGDACVHHLRRRAHLQEAPFNQDVGHE
jgi:hypothetical protein